jgi:hypothetical protein
MKIIARLLVLGLCAGTPAFAGGGYLYGLNPGGVMTCNGNKIHSHPSEYSSGDPDTGYLAWRACNIIGADQYALRADGLFYKNGVKQWKLQYNNPGWLWTDLKHSNGSMYALRQDGGLAVSNDVVAASPVDDLAFYYTALEVNGTVTYSLRSDGSVFRNAGNFPVFVFHAGNGIAGFPDGYSLDTLWIALKIKPGSQFIYALRSDGALYRAHLAVGSNTVQYVDSLPFPTLAVEVDYGDLYRNFGFDDATTDWIVLRTNGMVYREGDSLLPADDFEGNGNSSSDRFTNLAIYGGRYFAIRGDGKVYVEGHADPLLDLPGSDYGVIELTATPPNLPSSKNNAPYVVQYTIPVNTNLPVRVPVIATDVETPTPSLIVITNAAPTGAVWNATARELTWTAPELKGNHTFSYTVTDEGGSTKTYKSKIQVKYPDLVPEKNKPPYVPQLKKAMALVGKECRLYIPLGDPDNDPVTVSYVATNFPFSAGATYDTNTSEFVWTPTVLDIAKYTIPFTFSDGVNTKTFKLKLEVKSSIFIEPLPE